MSGSTTLTVRISPAVKKQLGRLAGHTRRTRSFLAGEAIALYVARELAIVEGVAQGLDDQQAGRVTPHADAMRRLRASAAPHSRPAGRAKLRAMERRARKSAP